MRGTQYEKSSIISLPSIKEHNSVPGTVKGSDFIEGKDQNVGINSDEMQSNTSPNPKQFVLNDAYLINEN